MISRIVFSCSLIFFAAAASAIECIASADDAQPILIIDGVSTNIDGVSERDMENALRERLTQNGKFRVLLPDQYQLAKKSGRIDRCTPVFSTQIGIKASNSDPGAAFGLRGLVTRTEFSAEIDIDVMPERVTIDRFSLRDKADTFIAGTEPSKAFARLFEKIATEFESRRERWVSDKIPGFGNPAKEGQ